MPTLDVSPVTEPSASDIARAMLSAHIVRVDTDTFRPMSVALKGPLFDNTIPTSIDDLPESYCRCYDLSVTAALQLNIPVIGSVSGGFGRRVVVSERCALKRITQDGIERDYGYAIRMCVTVDRWNADFKVNIPFLAASAQLGVIEASWLFQVVGLTGPKIDLNLPPTNLDVETFVIAKQSLEKIVSAIRDPTTKFLVSIIGETKPIDQQLNELHADVTRSYALTNIEKGRTLDEARKRLQPNNTDGDVLTDIYRDAGIKDPAEEPGETAQAQARSILGRVRADV